MQENIDEILKEYKIIQNLTASQANFHTKNSYIKDTLKISNDKKSS